MNPFLNQVYAGLNAPAAVNNYFKPRDTAPAATVAAPQPPLPAWQQGLMNDAPVTATALPVQQQPVVIPVAASVPGVNPFLASALGPVTTVAATAPSSRPEPPPHIDETAHPHLQGQMASFHQPSSSPVQASQDISVGVSTAPLRYEAFATSGRAAGELNTMGPEQKGFLTKAAGVEGNAATAAGANVASAMTAQQAPLADRAQYLTALAQREARDQGGRTEQNRQMLEDYEREAKELRDMKPDPFAYQKSGQGVLDGIAAVFGGIGQGFLRRSGDVNAQNTGALMAQGNRARFDAQQNQAIGQKQAYLQSIMQARAALRDTQNDQIASNQRAAGLRKEATGAQFDQAGIGVAMAEALSRGDIAQAQALSKLYQQQAAAMRYVPASGGGRVYQVKLANGAVLNMSEKEFNAYAKDNEKGTIETGQKIAVDSAKAHAEAKGNGKDDEARIVDLGNGQFYKARTTEEAIKLDEQRRALEQRQGAIMGVKEARGQVGFLDRVANNMTFGLIEPKSVANLDARSKALVEAEAKRSGGVVTESDREGAKLRVGDQTSFSPFKSNQERLNSVQAEIDRDKELLDRGRDITTRAPKPVKKGW